MFQDHQGSTVNGMDLEVYNYAFILLTTLQHFTDSGTPRPRAKALSISGWASTLEMRSRPNLVHLRKQMPKAWIENGMSQDRWELCRRKYNGNTPLHTIITLKNVLNLICINIFMMQLGSNSVIKERTLITTLCWIMFFSPLSKYMNSCPKLHPPLH